MNLRSARHLILPLFVFSLVVPLALAAAEEGKKADANKPKQVKVAGIYGKLDLSDDQRAQIKEIQTGTAAKIKALKEQEAEEILALLTDEQRQQLETLKQQQKDEKKAKGQEKKEGQEKQEGQDKPEGERE